MSFRFLLLSCLVAASTPLTAETGSPLAPIHADVCVYTATPSGILAAIAVKREGRSVVIVEPSRWVGGMLGAGLKPLQDCPNYNATGGMTHELLPKLGENSEPLVNSDRRSLDPKAIRTDFQALLEQHDIRVIFEHRISNCQLTDGRIQSASFDLAPFDELGCPVAEPTRVNHLRVSAGVFIDASYEGDLMAAAGVSYRVGRESTGEYGEELAGVREPMEIAPIDPFVEPGHPESGLLKWVEDDHGKPVGAADGYTQAYNYRYYTTANPDFRVPITAPDDYDPKDFELVGRYVEYLTQTTADAGDLKKKLVGIYPGWKNSGEWNYQRSSLFSMAPLGISQRYASGDYAEKADVWKAHQDYLRGLHTFMSTDPRVPESYRKEVAALGLDGRIHPETGGWPHQLYIRVSRRMEGRYTITADDVYNRTEVDDPIGLAQYGIDTYPARRIWGRDAEGNTWVGIEGKMFIGGGKGPTNVPYPIPYRAITPKSEECGNLLVPVCFSASHLGYASARMEPVFMMCGESAGIAACQALDEGVSVQRIDPKRLHQALEAAGQKLIWDPKKDQSSAGTNDGALSFQRLLDRCDNDRNQAISQVEWDAGKSGWEWLFPKIDSDESGTIDKAEYEAFQRYKTEHSDWTTRLKKESVPRS
ncbi:MAG: FAD-dependent oxidoreductase [Verrucomicrobiae bacterium]|nr:FAD-dependent oxidoreductase [Verrucomicrobiae bacterium]